MLMRIQAGFTHLMCYILQAWRKPGLQIVAKAFLREGLRGAYEAFASLPHTEAEYEKRFAFNNDVTKICYKDDKDCISRRAGQLADETPLWVSQIMLPQTSS